MIELSKDHIYTVNGVVLPSVSEIMRPLSEGHYSGIPERVMETARIRGTGVHRAIECYIKFGEYDPEYEPYMAQFKKWKEKEKITNISSEMMLTNGEYCGTIDMLIQTPEGIVLVDIKATYSINKELLEVQLAGYLQLLKDNGVVIVGTRVLHITPKKYSYNPIPVNMGRWEKLLHEYKNKEN